MRVRSRWVGDGSFENPFRPEVAAVFTCDFLTLTPSTDTSAPFEVEITAPANIMATIRGDARFTVLDGD